MPREDVTVIAYEIFVGDGETWGNGISFCLPREHHTGNRAIRCLGADQNALRAEDRGGDAVRPGRGGRTCRHVCPNRRWRAQHCLERCRGPRAVFLRGRMPGSPGTCAPHRSGSALCRARRSTLTLSWTPAYAKGRAARSDPRASSVFAAAGTLMSKAGLRPAMKRKHDDSAGEMAEVAGLAKLGKHFGKFDSVESQES